MNHPHLECFFVSPERIRNRDVVIDGREFRHLHRVKRKRVGDRIHATDGKGNFYTIQINRIRATQAQGEIVKIQRLVGEPLVFLTLAQGIIRSHRMDWIIEKGTELGVRRFIPVHTDFSRVESSELKRTRWRHLAQEAVKQCGRSYLPSIEPVVRVKELPGKLPRPVLFAHPGRKASVQEVLGDAQKKRSDRLPTVSLVVGPEGGFSEEEVECFREWGFYQIQLGERRLRAETAAIAFITLILAACREI